MPGPGPSLISESSPSSAKSSSENSNSAICQRQTYQRNKNRPGGKEGGRDPEQKNEDTRGVRSSLNLKADLREEGSQRGR